MPLKTVLEIFMQVCDGVECAHRAGILHRDLKPANIMVVTSPTGAKQVKILDFGLAKLTKHDRNKQSLTAVGDIFGSPFYMSPEQCKGDRLDNRSDIYSLGCSMFECLTGRPPFSGHLASAIMFSHMESEPPSLEGAIGPAKTPASMGIVMAKLLQKNPGERYQTLSQLKADLLLVAKGKEVLAVDHSSRSEGWQPAQSKRPAEIPAAVVPVSVGDSVQSARFLTITLSILVILGCALYYVLAIRQHEKDDYWKVLNTPGRASDDNKDPLYKAISSRTLVSPGIRDETPPAIWDGKPFYKGLISRTDGKLFVTGAFLGDPFRLCF
jgi:serine/threonine protein kinase